MNYVDHAKAQAALLAARLLWGIDEQWDIQIKWTDNVLADEAGSPTDIGIDMLHWPSKRATIEIANSYDISKIDEDMAHEVGHLVIAPLYRTVTDWLDTLLPIGTKERVIFEESYNSSENIVIDAILFQALRERRNG